MKKKITAVRETVELTPRGSLERIMVVEYMLDDFGPFTFEKKKRELSWEAVKQDMLEQEKGLKGAISEK